MKYFCISAILKKNRGVERLRDTREGNFAFVVVSSSGGASQPPRQFGTGVRVFAVSLRGTKTI